MKERVGIVLPHYDQIDHLPDALEGLRQQTHLNFDVVVWFDGKPYATHPGDKWLTQWYGSERRGTAEALNRGFEFLAVNNKYDFLTWVSADNVMHPDWLKTLLLFFRESPNTDFAYSAYVAETGKMIDGRWQPGSAREQHRPPKPLIADVNCFIGPSFLYRRSLHEKVGAHRGRISHDYDWWLRAEEHGQIGFVDKVLCTYRRHPNTAAKRDKHEFDAPHWQSEARRRRLQHGQAGRTP